MFSEVNMNKSNARLERELVNFEENFAEGSAENLESESSTLCLEALLDQVCKSDEFALLRETLRLYREEIAIH